MALPGFIFGGNTGVTPEGLRRDRAIAEAMLANAQRSGAPRNVGEGLSAIGQALMYRVAKGRAEKGDAVQSEKQAGIWSQLGAALNGGGSPLLGASAGGSASPLGSSPSESRSSASPSSGTSNAFLSSLIGTESGGRWDAQNDVSGAGGHRGHFGRLQFGKARLAEAAAAGVIPAGTSPQAFMASPEAQQAVENWHFADIDQQAARRGLTQFIGQEVGGARITQDAIRAMAHLGGIGGAERFLRSGGRHNPADAYGTSLLDYARKHGGASAAVDQIGVAHDPARPYSPPAADPALIARSMQGGGTQVASLDPSAGMPTVRPGAVLPDQAVVYDERGLRTVDAGAYSREARANQPRPANVVPYDGPGAQIDRPAPAPSKDAAVGQALGLRADPTPRGMSPAAAALNGIVQQPQSAAPAPQPVQYAQAQSGGVDPRALLGVMADPWASDEQRQVAQFLMQQQMAQQQAAQTRTYEAEQQRQLWAREDARHAIDDRREDVRLGIEMGQFEREGSKPIEVGGVLVDPNTMQPVYRAPAEPFTLNPGQLRFDGGGQQIAAGAPEAPSVPSAVQEYQFAVSQGYPGTFADWEQANRRAGATTINTGDTGGTGKFYEHLDKANADMFGTLLASGSNAQSNLARIDRLEGMLGELGSGWANNATLIAGNLGIDLGNASGVQAAQALINSMVPEQRAPGSGPMSDADLELFKQSLPRIINSPDGNRRIIETLRGVSQYQLSQADIAARVASRELSPEEGNRLLRSLPNPVAWLREAELPTPISAPIDSQGIPTITSKEAFDALPSGAEFLDPNGQKRRKP